MKKVIFVLVASALLVTACADSNQGMRSAPVKTTTVHIYRYAYNPPRILVSPSQTVTWINDDATPHTVTSNSFTSGPISPGQKFSHEFNQLGKYHYDCDFHVNMEGVVEVR